MIASWILAYGFFVEGKHAQAFPAFGAERRGAPVEAFVRMDDSFLNLRCRVLTPSLVVVMSEKLVYSVDVAAGLDKGGLLFINSDKGPEGFESLGMNFEIRTVDVTAIAVKNGLGSRTSPFINAPVLGALTGFSRLVRPESVVKGIAKFIKTDTEKNILAFRDAYSQTTRRDQTPMASGRHVTKN